MTFPWPRSIRAQLAAAITLALAVVLVLATMVSYFAVQRQLYANADAALTNELQSLTAMLEHNPNAAAVATEFYRDSIALDRTAYIQILSRENALLFLSPSLNDQRLPTSLLRGIATIRLAHEDARYITEASSWYYITVAVPVNNIESSLAALRITFTIAIPIALLSTLLIGYMIAKRGLRPIDRATAAARSISSRNLRERLPALKYDDEVGRLVRTLNEMIERLEKSFASISEFTTNAAHELRTPLTILRGELEVEARRRDLQPDYRAMIQSNIEEVNRITRIVENLFTLSRADSHELAMTLREVQLKKLLDDLLPRAETLAAPKAINVEVAIQTECSVIGDGEMLAQVMMNLIENAVKYSPEHSTITLGVAQRSGEALLTVTDRGIGVDESHKHRIFERFYRTDKARSRAEGGAGLGLSIAQSIVAAHRGMITVESTPGKGSVFTVALPLAMIE